MLHRAVTPVPALSGSEKARDECDRVERQGEGRPINEAAPPNRPPRECNISGFDRCKRVAG